MSDPSTMDAARDRAHFLDELRATFATRSGRPAIVHQDRAFTYGELEARARRCAARMRQLGVEPGDRVAIVTTEKLPFLAAHLGTLYAAAVSLPLNPRFTADELRYFLQDSGRGSWWPGGTSGRSIESLRPELPELRALMADSEAWDAPEGGLAPIPTSSRDDPCLMLYSSGTTGRPKGVVHTHANLASSLRALGDCWRFTPDDVLVNVLPLFHIHGLSFATHLSLLTGCRMLIEDPFHPRQTLDWSWPGHGLHGDPDVLLQLPRPARVPRGGRGAGVDVRLFTCGSAPIRPEVLPELEAILGRPVINRYGMTEAHVITSLPLDGPWPQGSVGLPLAGIEVRVVDDDGTPSRPGRGRLGSAPRAEPVPRVLAKAGRHSRGLRLRLVRYRRPGLPRRGRVPDAGRTQERSDHHQWIQRLSPGRRAGRSTSAPACANRPWWACPTRARRTRGRGRRPG